MDEKQYDKAFESLKIQHTYVKETIAKDKNFQDIVTVMKSMKNELFALHSKNPDKIQKRNEMIIKLCEQMAYCLLKENKPKEAIKILQELEIMQDIIKENNLKAIVYLGRSHLMLQNHDKAYDYFSKAYEIADEKTKKDIKSILDKIQEQNKNSNEERGASKMKPEGHSSTTLSLSDIQLTPMNSQLGDADGDIKMEVLAAKQQAESICRGNKYLTAIEICTIKPCAGILGEYAQKSGNLLPTYNLTKTTLESFNKKTFHFTCECNGRTESGSGSTKQKAREMAAQKMLKYLQNAGKLRLTTNLGL